MIFDRDELITKMSKEIDGGVCKSIEEILEELGYNKGDLSVNDLVYIDEHFFNCETCSWTMPNDDLCGIEDLQVCLDCYGEIE